MANGHGIAPPMALLQVVRMTEPQSAATPFDPGYGAQATTQLAGFWRRFVAYIIDAIIFGIVAGIIELIIAAIVRTSGADTAGTTVRGGIVSLIVGLLYFGYLWSRNGQTIGYMALGLRLVRADGQPVTFVVGMLRYLLIYLSFAICLIPAIISAFMIGLGQRKQGIHDLIVGTLVVRA
jgi:uncharacterized RDD family membrane protein YckC